MSKFGVFFSTHTSMFEFFFCESHTFTTNALGGDKNLQLLDDSTRVMLSAVPKSEHSVVAYSSVWERDSQSQAFQSG